MIDEYFISTLLTGVIITSIPLLLAAFGEMFCEQAGMTNLSIEGMMLAGAFTSFYIVFETQSYTLGFLGAVIAGTLLASIMFLFSIHFGINQIIVGIALTFAMQGLTSLLHKTSFSASYPRLDKIEGLKIPFFSEIPYIGKAFFGQPSFVLCSIFIICLISFFYNKSVLKLYIQALGYKEKALQILGVKTKLFRFCLLIFAGIMATLAGAFMSSIASGVFVPHMTHGTGYIALVLAMLARGKVLWLFLASFLFALCTSLGTALQLLKNTFSTDFIHMFPFIAILLLYTCIQEKK